MILGRMVDLFLVDKRVGSFPAHRLTVTLICSDVLLFVFQAGGTGLLSQPSAEGRHIGKYVFITGTTLQQIFVLLCVVISVQVYRRAKKDGIQPRKTVLRISWPLWISFVLISVSHLANVPMPPGHEIISPIIHYPPPGSTLIPSPQIRITYRTIEFSSVNSAAVRTHESYFYALDAAPISLAMLTWNIAHPGLVLPRSTADEVEGEENKGARRWNQYELPRWRSLRVRPQRR